MDSLIFELFWFIVFLAVFIHSIKSFKSTRNTLLFFIPAIIWSFGVELAGVHIWFMYEYSSTFYYLLWGVPISIAFGWATLQYIGYQISVHFSKRLSMRIDLESAILPTVIDIIILEPIAYLFKFWIWKYNNFWFGAPLFNFIGWFLIISLYLICYQWVTLKFPDYKKRVAYFLVVLLCAFVVLLTIAFVYLTVFGGFF